MSYNIYETNAWIIGGINVGESNRYIDIFTQEFGLIRGMVQGVRRLESKLKYGLQDLSFSRISLVKGRELWRIVNAERLIESGISSNNKDFLRLISRVFSLIKRLIRGEERDSALFDDVNSAIILASAPSVSVDNLSSLETVLVYRILYKLGYIPDNGLLNSIANFTDWNIESINFSDQNRRAMISQINESLAHSHL